MRSIKYLLLASSLLASSAYAAADKPVIVPIPEWVKPNAIPAIPDKSDEAPIRLLLSDQQIKIETGRQTVYSDVALRIQTPQGLAAGNLSLPWNPETDQLSVHKLLIHRGSETIDVLASGQTFTVVRREPNLESAMLDGRLTANIQPEGLQVGDVLELAITISSNDPVLNGHVEQIGAAWNGVPITRAHFKAQWPVQLPLAMRQSPSLPVAKIVEAGATSSVEINLDNVEPITPPKYAPSRYNVGRVIELSDFRSWADLGALMAPLYAHAAVVPADGPLRAELEKIKAASIDPVKRAEAALALVQDRVRYVGLLMGAGGYVPANAADTWSRRFGDCKGKTALLLGLLKELGISAEPVAVNLGGGDGFDQRLPMIGLFNHVLVRATVAGKSYWLDGTRTGDLSLDRLRTPDFGWGLPLVKSGAQLVRMQAAALEKPDEDLTIGIDARAGLTLPAPFKAEAVLRGDGAVNTKLSLASMTTDARDRALREYWKGRFDFVDVKSVSATFDAQTGEQRLTVQGVAKMDWKEGMYEADQIGLGYKADFTRSAGADQNAPYAVQHPVYYHTVEEIQLPPGFPEGRDLPNARVNEVIAGTEYRRNAQLVNNVFRIEASSRSIASEFPAKDAPAAEKMLRDLAERTVYLRRPTNYRMTEAELNAPLPDTAEKDEILLARGLQLLDMGQFDKATGSFDGVLAINPRNAVALANRGLAKAWMQQFDPASKDIDAALAIDPKNVVALRARGLLLETRNDSKSAIAAYGEAIALDASDSFSLGHRAILEQQAGNASSALMDAERALKLNPRWAQLRLVRANIFKNQGKRNEALAEARALITDNSGDGWAQVAAARIYSALNQKEEAMQAFDRALAIKPEAFIYVNRANIRTKEDIAGREADYDAALKLDPQMPDAIAGKANLLIERGNLTAAISTYSDALERSPDNIGLLSDRGLAYAKSGDMANADRDFATARERATSGADLNNLCWAKATAGVALEAALKDCDLALAKEPESQAVIDSRAFVLLRLSRLDEAIAAYDVVLAKSPTLPASLFGRAVALARKGDKAKAEGDRAAAIAVSPEVEKTFAGYGVTFP